MCTPILNNYAISSLHATPYLIEFVWETSTIVKCISYRHSAVLILLFWKCTKHLTCMLYTLLLLQFGTHSINVSYLNTAIAKIGSIKSPTHATNQLKTYTYNPHNIRVCHLQNKLRNNNINWLPQTPFGLQNILGSKKSTKILRFTHK